MKMLMTAAALCGLLTAPIAVNAEESEGKDLAGLAFSSIDGSERGVVDQGAFSTFGGFVFVSMDANDDNALSLGEFLSWDYGMEPLAKEAGREASYETALRVVFAFWDRNGDGKISKTEHRQSLMADFQRADANNDALLDEAEFTSGFSVMTALRAAINPLPVE